MTRQVRPFSVLRNGFALVMPYANTEAMQEFPDRFSATIADDEHVAMFADRAGWHIAGDLHVPGNIRGRVLSRLAPLGVQTLGGKNRGLADARRLTIRVLGF